MKWAVLAALIVVVAVSCLFVWQIVRPIPQDQERFAGKTSGKNTVDVYQLPDKGGSRALQQEKKEQEGENAANPDAPRSETIASKDSVSPEELELAKEMAWDFLTAGGADPGLSSREFYDQIKFEERDDWGFIKALIFYVEPLHSDFEVDTRQGAVTVYQFREAAPRIVEWVKVEGCAMNSSLPPTSPKVKREFKKRGWLLPEEALKIATKWVAARYPDFSERNFVLEVNELRILSSAETFYEFRWFEKPRPEKGELAVYENPIFLSLNPKTGKVLSYICTNIRLVVKQEPRFSKKDAVELIREHYPHFFEGSVGSDDPDDRGWTPPNSDWKKEYKVEGPDLCVYPKPGDIHSPIVYWSALVMRNGQWWFYIDAETGQFIKEPLALWKEYNKESQDK